MSETFKTMGIILKISDTPGKDKLLHILTRDGCFTAFFTPKRSAGKKSYTFDVFTYAELVLYRTGSDNLLVNSVTPINSFYNIRNNLAAVCAAGYFAQLAKAVAADAQYDSEQLLELLLKAFERLSDDADIRIIKPAFEFTAAKLLGFTPCLEADRKSDNYYFDFIDGSLHADMQQGCAAVSRAAVMYIYRVINTSAGEVFDILPDDCDRQDIYITAQQYLQCQTETEFPALKLLNGVL